MKATTTAPPVHRVEVINDLFNCRQEMETPVSRLRLIERLLFATIEQERSDAPEPALCACFHIYRDKIAVHFFALPGREEEALAAMREKGVDL